MLTITNEAWVSPYFIMTLSSSTLLATVKGQGFRERASLRKLGSCPEARCLNRIKQQPIRSIWDNNICQMNHFTAWPDNCPAPSYLEINPCVANSSGATWKCLPLAQSVAEMKTSEGYAKGKRHGRDTIWSATYWKQAFSPLVVRQHSITQVPSEQVTLGRKKKKTVKQDLVIRWSVKGQWPVGPIVRQLLRAPRGSAALCSNFVMVAKHITAGHRGLSWAKLLFNKQL